MKTSVTALLKMVNSGTFANQYICCFVLLSYQGLFVIV